MQDPHFAKTFAAPSAISEDCLYLNVWTPAKSADARLPVMVWIYGGSFIAGMTSSPIYDGTKLAQKGVVLVSIAYRVGAFGFLADPELSAENGGTSGNYGLEDLIAGLRWVKNNIANFGGNPSRVTIFGESSGAITVSMLAASPAAKGLFQGAISESGGSFEPGIPTLTISEASGHRFLTKLGVNNIQAARALSAEKIQAAFGPGLQAGFLPVFDGRILPGDQYELYSEGRFNDTPVLIGSNSDEGALNPRPGVTSASFESGVRQQYGKHADLILTAYPHATDAEAAQASKDLRRDSIFGWPTWVWAVLQSQKGHGKVYVYYFDHKTPESPHGATHGAEMVYVFHNLGAPGGGRSTSTRLPSVEEVALADLISTYWVNFATRGDPNGSGLPVWPAFRAKAESVMHFDGQPSAQPIPNIKQLKAIDTYYAWRRAQAHGK